MKMCAKWQICIIKTVGLDVSTRFCLEEEKKVEFFVKQEVSVTGTET